MADIIPLRPPIRRQLIDELFASSKVGLCEEDLLAWGKQVDLLSDAERELLGFKMEQHQADIEAVIELLDKTGANCLADLFSHGAA